MGEVLGGLLPLALGVAVSPIPVIAVILMLLAPRARSASVAFLLGWVVGVLLVVGVVTLVVDPVDDSTPDQPSTLVGVLKLALGVAALLVALRQWRSRPRAGVQPAVPAWMGAIASITPVRACGLGALLSAANPKNLTLCVSAGVAIGSGALTAGQTVVAVAFFAVLGSCSVAVPVLGYLATGPRMQAPLDGLRKWLTDNSAVVMAVLMLVIGVTVVGQALASF